MHSHFEYVNAIAMGHSFLPVNAYIFVTLHFSFSDNYCNNYGTACGLNVSHRMLPR